MSFLGAPLPVRRYIGRLLPIPLHNPEKSLHGKETVPEASTL
jgi:hypothetical protein